MTRSEPYAFPWSGLRRAWVADADAHTRAYLREALSRAGYRATLCEEPERILDPGRTRGQSFAVFRSRGPGMDLLRRLREQENLIPVLLLSETAPAGGGDLGIVGHLSTPFTSESLQAAISAILR